MIVSNRLSRFILLVSLTMFTNILGNAQASSSGVVVRIGAKDSLKLQVTIRSLARKRVDVYKSDLPWELHSIMLIAVRPNGQAIEQHVVAGDPSPEKISLDSNEAVTGEIDLNGVFKDLDEAIKKSEIHLFWAYRAPKGLNLTTWSGGWILLRQQR